MNAPIVIVGSGLAGYSLVREIRKLDKQVAITLVTADGGEVYSKPMLSNGFAQGKTPDALIQKSPGAAAAEFGIVLHTRTRVRAIDPDGRRIAVEGIGGSGQIPYGRLVLALGADPRLLPIPGGEAVPVLAVNDLDDYRAWRDRLAAGGRVLLIGAGLIGCEFANDLSAAGHPVAVVDPAPWPLSRLLPGELGGLLADALRAAGPTLHMGRTVSRIEAARDGFVARLDDGTEVPFDHALSAVGLAPRTDLARSAGLEAKAGILVDGTLRTSEEGIFALGDCAETAAGPLPFVLPLMSQAKALARTLTGEPTALQLPALPVVVKTPALPVVVCPPKAGAAGAWEVSGEGNDRSALFKGADGTELGFALTGAATAQRQALARRMPDLVGGG